MEPITDMFNRIMNAQAIGIQTVEFPFSNLKGKIVEILKKEDFIADMKKKGKKPYQTIKILLKYADKNGVISGFKRVSKPGQRIYRKAHEIRRVKNGYGISIISTNRGLMTDKEARRNKTGGEVMVEVW